MNKNHLLMNTNEFLKNQYDDCKNSYDFPINRNDFLLNKNDYCLNSFAGGRGYCRVFSRGGGIFWEACGLLKECLRV